MAEKEFYSELEMELAHYTRAIGHPARVAVLIAIAKKGEWVQGEIIEVPQISKATVIQHLRELKRAGLISGRIFGTKAHYGINWDNISKFQQELNEFVDTMKQSQN